MRRSQETVKNHKDDVMKIQWKFSGGGGGTKREFGENPTEIIGGLERKAMWIS